MSNSPLTSLPVARRLVLDAVRVLPAELVALGEALGRVTAEVVASPSDIPSFANSSMDGYALHAADTRGAPVRLAVIGQVLAGQVPAIDVGRGEAVKIMTGAPMPALADAVVQVERTHTDDARNVVVEAEVDPGSFVRHPGEDMRAGQVVFEPGTVLSPAHIGVLASIGVESVSVHGVPRVGVLSTGDELASDAGALAPGKIRDANRPSLLALVRQAGFPAIDLGVVRDEEEEIATALSDAAVRCDAVLTSGGVSMGDVDLVKVVLDKLTGGSMRWLQVAIKPAKPFAFGLLEDGGVPVFGLAGNPVSAVVGFELFARPALRRMAGHRPLDRPIVNAVADVALARPPDGKLHLMRVVAHHDPDGNFHVRPSGGQGSHMLHATAQANAFALVPDGTGVGAGERVEVMLLDVDELGGSSDALGSSEDRA